MKLQDDDPIVHERLAELMDAERKLVVALPRLAARARSAALRAALRDHLRETAVHVERLAEVMRELGVEPAPDTCLGMQGLLDESEESLRDADDDHLADRALATAARKIEHYEIVAYEDLVSSLERMGRSDLAEIVAPTLLEEIDADKRLCRIADSA